MRNQIVVLAAGKGTRMGESELPKVLVMLNNKPLILHLLEEVDKINQLIKPVIVVGYKHQQVMDVLGDSYLYAYQDQQLGTGHAVMSAERVITGENILVLYGDMPFIKAESLRKLMALHQEKKPAVSMFTSTVADFTTFPSVNFFGRIIRNQQGNIVKITEYKDASPAERDIREVNPGIYMFNTDWLYHHIRQIQNANAQGEYYLTDMVELAIADAHPIESLAIAPEEVVGINSREELLNAEQAIIKN